MNEEFRILQRQYYLTMTVPFVIDMVITAIVVANIAYPGILERNLLTGGVLLLAGLHLYARWRYAPIAAALTGGVDMKRMEKALTQLPLHSAKWAGSAYIAAMSLRLLPPLIFDGGSLFGTIDNALTTTWLDAILTIAVSGGFMFVATYFIASDFLERLCARIFAASGANLGLFFGRFATKIGVASSSRRSLPWC
jgi:hypothetical protein